MGPLKLGATKKGKRKAPQKTNSALKKAKLDLETKPVQNANVKKTRKKASERSTVDLVHNEPRDLSEQDLLDFDEYEHFQGFLQNLDPESLARKVRKQGSIIPQTSQPLSSNGRPSQNGDDHSENDTEATEDCLSDLETDSQGTFDGDSDDIVSENDSINETDVLEPSLSVSRQNNHSKSASSPNYEMHVRSFKVHESEQSERLPIKLSDGSIKSVPRTISQSIKDGRQILEDIKEPYSAAFMEKSSNEKPRVYLSSEERLTATKERLAKIAMEIIEDPEQNIDQLAKIREIQNKGDLDEKRYATLTLSAIFKDIIPGYRIRPLTAVERTEKTTKEVRALRSFEQSLVGQYQDFINSLVGFSKLSRKSVITPQSESLKATAITAACSLLTSAPHFNFRTELSAIVISQICRRTVDELFNTCRRTIEELFREDQEGEASFEAMRLLCKKMKDRDYQVDESTLGTFLHIRLLSEMEARGSTTRIDHEKKKKKDRQFRTKKLKKFMKDQKEVERDLREAEATVNIEVRERLQGDMLKLAFTTYFRVLKDGSKSMIGAALEGLAKFAHLINVDFFGDLLEVLKELMQDDPSSPQALSTRDTLLCVVTAFTLLSGQGATKETIALDLSKFMDRLYSILLNLALNPDIELSHRVHALDDFNIDWSMTYKVNVATEAEMLLRALDVILFKHRPQGNIRLSAFVKRLSTASLQFPEKSSTAALELMKRLAARNAKLYSLYSTEEIAGDGVYNGQTDSLDLSNPSATSVWELALLRRHYAPKVKRTVQGLIDTLNDSMSAKS